MIGKADFCPTVCWFRAGIRTAFRKRRAAERPPIFNVTYTEQVFNLPLRGAREQQEQAKAQKICWKTRRIP